MVLTLFPYIALALNLVLVLALFFGMNRTLWKLRTRVNTCEGKVESAVLKISEEVNCVNRKISDLTEIDSEQPASFAATSTGGINMTLRSKALKMHRMGQTADRIAESLRVPKGEVELLVKVHQVVMRPYENGRPLVPEDVAV